MDLGLISLGQNVWEDVQYFFSTPFTEKPRVSLYKLNAARFDFLT